MPWNYSSVYIFERHLIILCGYPLQLNSPGLWLRMAEIWLVSQLLDLELSDDLLRESTKLEVEIFNAVIPRFPSIHWE